MVSVNYVTKKDLAFPFRTLQKIVTFKKVQLDKNVHID
jgi:hypothetical protein